MKLVTVKSRIVRDNRTNLYLVQIRTEYLRVLSSGWWTIVPDNQKDNINVGFKTFSAAENHLGRVASDIKGRMKKNERYSQITETKVIV